MSSLRSVHVVTALCPELCLKKHLDSLPQDEAMGEAEVYCVAGCTAASKTAGSAEQDSVTSL